MPWFEYEGLTPGGTAIAGRIEGPDREQVVDDLEQMQIEVRELRVGEEPPRPMRSGLTSEDLMFFNEQLASLASAGIALDDGLAQLARDVESPRLKRWLDALVDDLKKGEPVDRAISRREGDLPILYSRVIRAGIQSGELPATLLNLNHHLRLVSDTKRIVWEIVSYPLLVMVLAMVIVTGFLTMVTPQFKEIFQDFGTELPGLTKVMIWMSDHFMWFATIGAAVVAAIFLGWQSLRLSPGGRRFRERVILLIPGIGTVHRASLIARFLRSVAMATGSEIPLPDAMRLASDATGSLLLQRDAEALSREAEQGHSILAASQATGLIPPMFGLCVQTGAERGSLPNLIAQLARAYEQRTTHAQMLLKAMLFPLMVIILGVFLAGAVLAMFLPLLQLINSVSIG